MYTPSETSTSGISYCFATSDGRIGWANNVSNTGSNGALTSELIHVRVWDK